MWGGGGGGVQHVANPQQETGVPLFQQWFEERGMELNVSPLCCCVLKVLKHPHHHSVHNVYLTALK